MMLKRIEAPTLPAALAAVARQCGDDALVVETRRTPDGYAIVAARAAAPTARRGGRTRGPAWTRGFAPLANAATRLGIDDGVLRGVERALIGTRVDHGRRGDPGLPAVATRLLKGLIRTTTLPLPDFKITALIGPTGVGKTTTLAKLAAGCKKRGERTALLSVDSYRIAAADQLRALADMLQMPFHLLRTPSDMMRALARHAGDERILVDTTGYSPFDADAIGALQGALRGGRPACLLCLPAVGRRVDLEAAVDGFAPLAPQAAIITKWDETQVPGEALSIAIERRLPISHVTIGQEIPADIVDADAGVLAAAAFALGEQQAEAVL